MRIRQGARPVVLDLFAGCGGLSLGFHSAGFLIGGAIEKDKRAAETHAFNFFGGREQGLYNKHNCVKDITEITPRQLIRELFPEKDYKRSIDVIVGGPPCQAFSRVGRAKLREVREHPEAFLQDPRGDLYQSYLKYVRELRPVALLIENVPDMLNYGGRNIAEEICCCLSKMGYLSKYTLLNSAHYGVPQMRERTFIIAYAKEIEKYPVFPEPTHWINLPAGYRATRNVAIKNIISGLSEDPYFIKPPEPNNNLQKAITASQALEDLPHITSHLEGKLKKGIRRFDILLKYKKDIKLLNYAILMRNWPGFENNTGVYDHVLRYLPRDYPIFQRMKPGDEYPQAYELALCIFNEKLEELKKNQNGQFHLGTPEYMELMKKTVPPYDSTKFPNRWRKLEPDKPVRTLTAHLGRDSYSHIHYDSEQGRTITPREAARLQSFPDGFVFKGAMDAAFRQIGNAVPPLLANKLACTIGETLGVKTIDIEAEVNNRITNNIKQFAKS